uniref:Uncharacterized protein n=1 Tax=Rhizophora mucronata TaxID=61149 RepID=A0A2P2Q0C9_RHIMU
MPKSKYLTVNLIKPRQTDTTLNQTRENAGSWCNAHRAHMGKK